MSVPEALKAHLQSGATQVCRAWELKRRDGVRLGFTDHDLDLTFDDLVFHADTGLSSVALEQTTGLSVDNTEAMGVLSHVSVSEADIEAGRFDGAEVLAWTVNWADVSQRVLRFRGTLGEIRRSGGVFKAELSGLTERLNQAQGRIYQSSCAALLGDAACQFDVSAPGYQWRGFVSAVEDRRMLAFDDLSGFDEGWFDRGRVEVMSGPATGLIGLAKTDRVVGSQRQIELWEPLRAAVAVGDEVLLQAGCDRRMETCRAKFNNLLNFRGFPHIPGEDWLMTSPSGGSANNGGSLNK